MSEAEAIDGKPMGASFVHMSEIVMPNDTNPRGTLSGGRLMHWVDIAAAMSAMRHARRQVVTVAVDDVVFRAPVPEGFIVMLDAGVTCVGRTSMEVRVDVRAENPVTGEQCRTTTAHLVFVALEDGQPTAVPPVFPETDVEVGMHERALRRRAERLEMRGRR